MLDPPNLFDEDEMPAFNISITNNLGLTSQSMLDPVNFLDNDDAWMLPSEQVHSVAKIGGAWASCVDSTFPNVKNHLEYFLQRLLYTSR